MARSTEDLSGAEPAPELPTLIRRARRVHPTTAVFGRSVAEAMRAEHLTVAETTPIREVVARMAETHLTGALVVDGEGRLSGLLTEHDVTSRVALVCSGEEPVADLMTRAVEAIDESDYLYHAIALMRRRGWRHLPVLDPERRPVGVVDLRDALSLAADETLAQIDAVSHEGTLEGLKAIKAAQVELATRLMEDTVPASDIQALITDINRDIHRRVIERHLAAMAEEGWGPPPVAFSLLIMGSGGRGENYLYPDQDNGFILEDYPDERHGEIDPFFIELAERMTRELDAIGFPLCRGYVMATNPVWRKTIAQWCDQVVLWGRKRSTIAVQFSDIFFDFTHGYGEASLTGRLREVAAEMTARSPAFLQALFEESDRHSVALRWLGRLRTESEPEHRGKINLKHGGTLPLVTALRLYALKHRVTDTATLRRIAALTEAGVLQSDEADGLGHAYRHITHLLLRQQLRDFRDGREVGNFVDPRVLTTRERDLLVDSLKAIKGLRERIKLELTGDVF